MELIRQISKDLNVPEDMLFEALKYSRKYVRHLSIKKRNGTERKVYQPSKKLKVIQYWLIANLFSKMPVHSASVAYRRNTCTLDNAHMHARSSGKYYLKLDFKDFFPSIRFEDLSPIIRQWHENHRSENSLEDLLRTVKAACFYKEDRLPIGYPTSPIISNVIMYNFDSILTTSLSDINKYGMVVYSRYADDLTFSTNMKHACVKIKFLVEETSINLWTVYECFWRRPKLLT